MAFILQLVIGQAKVLGFASQPGIAPIVFIGFPEVSVWPFFLLLSCFLLYIQNR
jgi:hypothetical protein